ncbi:hypothetical protein M9435_000950 [Picochlorum sp. BPE23]|nr:hypothetical protein M9435_000950 [Picochlorum sp. BPE23]
MTEERNNHGLCGIKVVAAACISFMLLFYYMQREKKNGILLLDVSSVKEEGQHQRNEVILHIGSHKISSTYIQSKMCSNSTFLASLGLHVPIREGCKCNAKVFASVAFALQNNSADARRLACSNDPIADFSNSLQPNRSYFISSEEFDNLNDDGVRKLRDLLTGFDVKIVVFYRSKLDHLISYYSQEHKGLKTNKRFQDFLWDSIFLRQDQRVGGIFYSNLLRMYSSYFGAENVHVLSYNGMLAQGIDPWNGLLGAIYPDKIDQKASVDDNGRKNSYSEPLMISTVATYNQLSSLLEYGEQLDATCAKKLPSFRDFDKKIRTECDSKDLLFSAWMDAEIQYFHDANFKLFWFGETSSSQGPNTPYCFQAATLGLDSKSLKVQIKGIREEKLRLC